MPPGSFETLSEYTRGYPPRRDGRHASKAHRGDVRGDSAAGLVRRRARDVVPFPDARLRVRLRPGAVGARLRPERLPHARPSRPRGRDGVLVLAAAAPAACRAARSARIRPRSSAGGGSSRSTRSSRGRTTTRALEPMEPGARVSLRRDLSMTCFEADHRVPTLAYVASEERHRLLPEYESRTREEIKVLAAEGKDVAGTRRDSARRVLGRHERRDPRSRSARVLPREGPPPRVLVRRGAGPPPRRSVQAHPPRRDRRARGPLRERGRRPDAPDAADAARRDPARS